MGGLDALVDYCIADKSRFGTLKTAASDFRFSGVLLEFQAFDQKEMNLIDNADKSRFGTLKTAASDFRFTGVLHEFQAFDQKEMNLIDNTRMIIIQNVRHKKEHAASIQLNSLSY